MTNFWSFLLAGLVSFIQNVIITPLFGGPENYHTAMGLGSIMGSNAMVILQLAVTAFANFNLTLLGWGLGISMVFWLIKLVVNTYLAIKRLIPFIG
jgi:hypothetical protein